MKELARANDERDAARMPPGSITEKICLLQPSIAERTKFSLLHRSSDYLEGSLDQQTGLVNRDSLII
jgi:hypothetical protein